MKDYLEFLKESFQKTNSVICFGMDPDIKRMKCDRMKHNSTERLDLKIAGYFIDIMEAIKDKISAVKPNLGYYLRYGDDGFKALKEVVKKARDFSLPIILDMKAGDIGKTSEAYAEFAFKQLKIDAVTLNPYLGLGALSPFFKYREKGFYILVLTTNPDAREFEYLSMANGKKLYEIVFDSVVKVNIENPGAGMVIGATHEREIEGIIKKLAGTGRIVPVLVPGVGAQGGDLKKILFWFNSYGYHEFLIRINLSSYIAYAHERFPELRYTEASLKAIDELIS